jgi:hypothetical protein
VILFLASPVSAQLGNQLSSYTGRNASGYLEPLVDAFGADLNAGLYHSARIPQGGLHLSFELLFMSVRFSDADKWFMATTEQGFRPETTMKAPTVVGSKKAVYVDGESGTRFAFPGGFDLDSFDFAVPQLRVGTLLGTEAIFRFALFYTGDSGDLGSFNLYGLGLRHSISQYFDKLPIDVAVGTFWQRFTMGENERGDDLVEAEAFTVGLNVSKQFSFFEPYAGFSYDNFAVDLSYVGDTAEDNIDMSLDSDDNYRGTFGAAFNFGFFAAHGEYNIGGQDAFAIGLALRYHP